MSANARDALKKIFLVFLCILGHICIVRQYAHDHSFPGISRLVAHFALFYQTLCSLDSKGALSDTPWKQTGKEYTSCQQGYL
jgi:hypothetical protein